MMLKLFWFECGGFVRNTYYECFLRHIIRASPAKGRSKECIIIAKKITRMQVTQSHKVISGEKMLMSVELKGCAKKPQKGLFWIGLKAQPVLILWILGRMLKGNWGQDFTSVFCIFFVNFIEEELSTKYCGVLIIFHEVMKLQTFELDTTGVMPANLHNLSPVFLRIFKTFMKKDSHSKNYDVFDHF